MKDLFLTASELQAVLSTLRSFNTMFPLASSEIKPSIAPSNPLVLTDTSGNAIGSIDYSELEDQYVFRYPEPTDSESTESEATP